MSKYTSQDPDILLLTIKERVNYECELLNFNVEANTQAHTAMQSIGFLSNPSEIADKFKNPKDIPKLLLLLCFFLVFICIITLIILYIIYAIIKDNKKITELILNAAKYICFMIITLVVILFIYNKLQLQLANVVQMVQTGTPAGITSDISIDACEEYCSIGNNAYQVCQESGEELCDNNIIAQETCQKTCKEHPNIIYNQNSKETKTNLSGSTIGLLVGLSVAIVILIIVIVLFNNN